MPLVVQSLAPTVVPRSSGSVTVAAQIASYDNHVWHARQKATVQVIRSYRELPGLKKMYNVTEGLSVACMHGCVSGSAKRRRVGRAARLWTLHACVRMCASACMPVHVCMGASVHVLACVQTCSSR